MKTINVRGLCNQLLNMVSIFSNFPYHTTHRPYFSNVVHSFHAVNNAPNNSQILPPSAMPMERLIHDGKSFPFAVLDSQNSNVDRRFWYCYIPSWCSNLSFFVLSDVRLLLWFLVIARSYIAKSKEKSYLPSTRLRIILTSNVHPVP